MSLSLIAQTVFALILLIAAANTAWVVYLLRLLRRPTQLPSPGSLSKTAVFLCLKGADPRLRRCLDGLMKQDHPDFEVMVMVDSGTDPAWSIVQAAQASHGIDRLRVWTLENRRTTCGLKNSALIQLLDQLDASHETIAMIDSDVEPHPTWLRELVAPLADQQVGVSFGNRWFLPDEWNTGSLVRQLWNGPGLIVMSAFKIPWAGSMAVRRSLMDSEAVRDKLAHSIVDDGPLRVMARQQGLRAVFVPSVIMANREVCDFRFACNFIRRQLTWTRTYFSHLWPAMVAYHWLATVTSTASEIIGFIGWYRGDIYTAVLGFSGIAISLIAALFHHLAIDRSARRVIQRQGDAISSITVAHWLRLSIHLSLAAVVGLCASVLATIARRILWRGVLYEINGPWNVRMLSETTTKDTANSGRRADILLTPSEPSSNVSL